jgi:pilus assembly protein CpaF
MSFEVILPFLRPIEQLILDPDITEIMVNGSRRVFIERAGLIEEVAGVQVDERNLKVAVKNIARPLGDDISEERPILDSRLPDRIIVGEVRGGEAFDLLQALNTGHAGTLSTIHANSAEQALARFAACVAESGVELPYQAVRHQIAEAVDLVLQLGRHNGIRVIEELIRLERYDVQRNLYDTVVLFDRNDTHRRPRRSGDDVRAAGDPRG